MTSKRDFLRGVLCRGTASYFRRSSVPGRAVAYPGGHHGSGRSAASVVDGRWGIGRRGTSRRCIV